MAYWLRQSATTRAKSPAAAPLSFHILPGSDFQKRRHKNSKFYDDIPQEELQSQLMNFEEVQEKWLECR